MRYRPDRQARALHLTSVLTPVLASTLALAAAGLGGCDKLVPNTVAPGTLALLREGSEKACVASDVHQLLRGLIVPKPADLGSDTPEGDVRDASAQISLVFDTTTLEATDKSVNRVTCDTVVHVQGPQGQAGKFRATYQVSPSAENANAVVVSGDVDDARAFATARINDALAARGFARAQQQQAAQDAQAHAQLLALITPKWLVGTWIETGADPARCSNGQGFAFRANHAVVGTELAGRWALTSDHLHAVGQDMSGAAEIDGTITAADQVSFTVTTKDGAAHGFRRCSVEEVNAGTTDPTDSFAPAPPSLTSQN